MTVGTLLIRADAGPFLGAGHFMRCLAIAQAWQDANGRAVFAIGETTPALEERLLCEGVTIDHITAQIGSRADSAQTVSIAATHDAEWVAVDGYHFGEEYQRSLKEAGARILFLDDNGHAAHYSADLVLNQNAFASEDLYRKRDLGTELLLGLPYAMLRREFHPWRGVQRTIPNRANKILVTLGGSDPSNVTPRVIQALMQVGSESLEGVIVAGASNPHTSELESMIAAGARLRLLRNVANMPEWMAWADLAVSAAGITMLEMAFMGVPTILVTVADNQEANAQASEQLGFAVNLGDMRQVSTERLAAALRELITDFERRMEMTRKGRNLVDGKGSERVVARLIANRRSGNR